MQTNVATGLKMLSEVAIKEKNRAPHDGNGFSMRTLLSQGFGQSVAMTGGSAKSSTQNRVACH